MPVIRDTTPTVDAISEMHFEGNIIPHTWYQHLRLNSGIADLVAITVLAEIVFWYRASYIHDETTGELVAIRKKFHKDKLQRSIEGLSKKLGLTYRQVKDALFRLEKVYGVIQRLRRPVEVAEGIVAYQVLFLEPVPEKVHVITYSHDTGDAAASPHRRRSVTSKTPERPITEITTEITTKKKEEIPLISPMGKLCKNNCDGIEGIDNQPITTTMEATPIDRLQPQDGLVVEEESPERSPLPFPTCNTLPTQHKDPSPSPSRRRRTGPSPELLADADEVLAHLCEVTGKQFRVHGEIATILRKGYTKAQCLLVIDWLHIVRRNRSKMDREWVEQRLGITTPFYEKNFAGYLADAELLEQKKDSSSLLANPARRSQFLDYFNSTTR